MVPANDAKALPELPVMAKHLVADNRMSLHLGALLWAQFARLVQNLVWNADFADIVHQCAELDIRHLLVGELKLARQSNAEFGDTLGVHSCGRISEVDALRHLEHRVARFLLNSNKCVDAEVCHDNRQGHEGSEGHVVEPEAAENQTETDAVAS